MIKKSCHYFMKNICPLGEGKIFHTTQRHFTGVIIFNQIANLSYLFVIAMFVFPRIIQSPKKPFQISAAFSDIHWGMNSWDGEYFQHNAEKGYVYEKNHAFLPLNSIIIRLSKSLFKSDRYQYNMIKAFILQPGLVYMMNMYSQTLFIFFTVLGVYVLFRRESILNLLSASFCFSLATLTRSNGVLNLIFILWSLIQQYFHPSIKNQGGRCQRINFCRTVFYTFIGITCMLIVIVPLFYVTSVIPYQYYCIERLKLGKLDLSQWCYDSVPNLYTWVQRVYWDNGFLKNFTNRQILDKLPCALPVFVFTFIILRKYIKYCQDLPYLLTFGIISRQYSIDSKRVMPEEDEQPKSLSRLQEIELKPQTYHCENPQSGQQERDRVEKIVWLEHENEINDHRSHKNSQYHQQLCNLAQQAFYTNRKLWPFIIHMIVSMALVIFYGNIEISNRIASGCPLLYLVIAHHQFIFSKGSDDFKILPYTFKLIFIIISLLNMNLVPTNLAFL